MGRQLVNLLPVAQRTNTLTDGVVDRLWVVGRELKSHTSTMKTLFKEKRISLCQESDKSLSLGPNRLLRTSDKARIAPYEDQRPRCSEGGESVLRLGLGRRLVNLRPTG